MYDIIPDIHGHADELEDLLAKLGYRDDGAGYAHPQRQAVFLGDFIDRGLKIKRVLEIVRRMVKRGSAQAVMGNHEFNAIAYHTPAADRETGYLRKRDKKTIEQHQQTVDQLSEAEQKDAIDWFRRLPFWLDLGKLRVVHACWDEAGMEAIGTALVKHGSCTDAFMQEATLEKTLLFNAIENVLKGPEAPLPPGYEFKDKGGHTRNKIRIRWYLPLDGHTYSSYALMSKPPACDRPLVESAHEEARPYPAGAPPVFFGHYWLRGDTPALLAPNVACLDYSVAKGGILCAYRWDGEQVLDPGKFVVVANRSGGADQGDEE